MVFCSILYVRPYRLHTDYHIEIDIEQKLEIIKLKERRKMDSKEGEERWEIFERAESGERKEISQKISSFFSNFGDFFDSDAKKAVFLEGVLAQFLLDAQSQERGGATPFKANLNRGNLDEKEVKKLFPKIQTRLEDYGENNYHPLATIISKYFVLAGSGWRMSKEEISFCFQLGMNLSCLFGRKKEGEKSENR